MFIWLDSFDSMNNIEFDARSLRLINNSTESQKIDVWYLLLSMKKVFIFTFFLCFINPLLETHKLLKLYVHYLKLHHLSFKIYIYLQYYCLKTKINCVDWEVNSMLITFNILLNLIIIKLITILNIVKQIVSTYLIFIINILI